MVPLRRFSADDPDERLMLAYASGSAEAFDLLYVRHQGPVYLPLPLAPLPAIRNRRRAVPGRPVNVVRARAPNAPAVKFTTSLCTLAHHRVVDHWSANARGQFAPVDDADGEAREHVASIAGGRGDEPETRVVSPEIGARLALGRAALPVLQRDAFLLRPEAGLSLAEIATMTGTGVETIKTRVRYTVAKLRAQLADLT